MDYKALCLAVCDVARKAGEYIARERETFTRDRIESKGIHNFVSYVDKGAEKQIVEALTALLPEAGIIAEEGSGSASDADRYRWVIDPLDGTTNFVHGLPPYAVSIGLLEGSKAILGVVYEVTVRECFYAWQGGGAWMNDRPISVSSIENLDDALILTGISYDSEREMNDIMRCFEFFNCNSHGARRLGSAATDLVYVACGRSEGFYHTRLSPWDVAAGACIVREAGGIISDYEGGDDYIFGRSILAANTPRMADILRKIVTESPC